MKYLLIITKCLYITNFSNKNLHVSLFFYTFATDFVIYY